ncbi:MAG: glycosyltransferase [Elusimicrobia bacterium]|nr:glycosyltransferase [Elusimicrobiota bacterium]
MVTKQNLLIITPKYLDKNSSAGDYRVYSLIKNLHKYFNICLMVTDTSSKLKDKSLNRYIKSYLKKTSSITTFKKYLKEYKIDYCLFERYSNLSFDLYNFIPLTKSIIDIHEIGFIKTLEFSKIQKIDDYYNKVFKAKELLFYQNAKLLICISEKEKEILKNYFPNKQIIVVPTCTEIHKVKNDFNQRKDICFLGSFKYLPNVDAVKYFAEKIFPKLNSSFPDMKFYVLGSDSSMFENKYKNVFTKENIKNICKELSKYKLFVCPLRYGAGLKKKTLDAMASKTPVVSTKFGVEGIKNLENKYVSSQTEFINEIKSLYTNKKLWNKQAVNNFNIVNKYYSQNKFSKYLSVLLEQLSCI